MRSVLIVTLLFFGCGAPSAPTTTVLVCDRSTSATCSEDLVEEAATVFLNTNPAPGSRFEVLSTGCTVEDVDRSFALDVPVRWGAGVAAAKKSWRKAADEKVTALTLPPQRACSGIAAAIWEAGRVLDEHHGKKQLIVLSDLREVTRSLGLNLERSVPTPASFVATLKKAELVPDLALIAVEVCGVHDRGTPNAPRWSAHASIALRLTWGAAFTTMGVTKKLPLVERCSFEGNRLITLARKEK